MDYRWAATFLVEHVQAIDQCGKRAVLTKERRAVIRALNERIPTVNAILAALAPDLSVVIGGAYLRDHQSDVSWGVALAEVTDSWVYQDAPGFPGVSWRIDI